MGRPPRITREQILTTARAAFGARGFSATTLADVAKDLLVTPAALLRHFASKEELFQAAMSTRGVTVPDFIEALSSADGSEDPRVILGNVARKFIPFISGIIRPAIAVQMHATSLVMPFDPKTPEAPPVRALRILSGYLERAMKAGTVRSGDPRAMALLFLGQLQSYVFFHQIFNISPAYPQDEYIEALLGLWSDGAFRGGSRGRKSKRSEEVDSGTPATRRRGRSAVVPARGAKAEAARAGRNPGGKGRPRRVSGGGKGRPRARR